MTSVKSFGTDEGQFQQCVGITVDSWFAYVYVADGGNHRFQVFTPEGVYVDQFGSQGTGPGEFDGPRGVAVDPTHMYVADTGNFRIQKLSLGGTYLLEWGSEGYEPGEFTSPRDVEVPLQTSDRIWVSDDVGGRVQVFDPEGAYLADLYGSGYGATPGPFCSPEDVAIMDHGHGSYFWVADTRNHRVQLFDLSFIAVERATWGKIKGKYR